MLFRSGGRQYTIEVTLEPGAGMEWNLGSLLIEDADPYHVLASADEAVVAYRKATEGALALRPGAYKVARPGTGILSETVEIVEGQVLRLPGCLLTVSPVGDHSLSYIVLTRTGRIPALRTQAGAGRHLLFPGEYIIVSEKALKEATSKPSMDSLDLCPSFLALPGASTLSPSRLLPTPSRRRTSRWPDST